MTEHVKRSRPLILGLDFDGTVVKHEFPAIGSPAPHCLEVLRRVMNHGHMIILWTCRENEQDITRKKYLDEAVQYLKDNGIKLQGINENGPEDDFRVGSELKRKIYADVYVDDKGLIPLKDGVVDWEWVEARLEERGWFE